VLLAVPDDMRETAGESKRENDRLFSVYSRF